MGSRQLKTWVSGLATMLLVYPVVAQEVATQASDQGDYLVVTEDVLSPEQRRAAKESHARQMKLVVERGAFGAFLMELDQPRRAIACGKVAEYFANGAATASDPGVRAQRLPEAWRLSQRVAAAREAAMATMSKRDLERFETLFNETLTMQSLIPDPAYSQVEPDFSEGGFDYQFASILAMRCNQSLDENGVPEVSGDAPAEYFAEKVRFRFRGADYATVFDGTDLAPFARQICEDQPAPDFTNAPLEQRGYEEMSLLDWAIECNDRASFEALLAAGFDLDATGLWQDPPLVRSATEKRLWFLEKLLDAGANPDAIGANKTALAEALSDLDASNRGGDARAAFNLLRERGASLNFPDFGKSIWFEWGLFGRKDGWKSILDHWDEFDSDPVKMAELVEGVLDGNLGWLKDQKPAARKVKALLIDQFGVCFPVGNTFDLAKDERGFLIQPGCPKKG